MIYMIKQFDPTTYIERNEQVARELYGLRLDKDRRVIGTNIWFDSFWRIHIANETND